MGRGGYSWKHVAVLAVIVAGAVTAAIAGRLEIAAVLAGAAVDRQIGPKRDKEVPDAK